MTDRDESDERIGRPARRTFLKTAGAVGATAVAGGTVSAQIESTTIRLNGVTSGWVGQEPASIEGTVNPALNLEPGTEYTVIWTNGDGAPHNLVVESDGGEKLVSSEVISEQGATQRVTFTATEQMAEYYCVVHPTSMRGQIGEGGQAASADQQPVVPEGPSAGVETVADGFTYPLSMEYAEEDRDRRFVIDQTGQIYVHGPDGLRDEPFLDVTDRMVDLQSYYDGGFSPGALQMDERGLTGLAFHPNFADNRKFYVHYSVPPEEANVDVPEAWDHAERISEFEATRSFENGDPESERVLLEIPHPQFNHNAGPVLFGPDGYLYITMGDGGGANDTYLGHVDDWYDGNEGGNGQDITQNLLGSILRIDVDAREGEKPYGVPDDNPLVGTEGLDEIYAWGLRNPWRATFNDGDLYVGDVGQSLYEEINIVENGGNYGWNVREGTACFNADRASSPLGSCPQQSPRGNELLDPALQYPQTRDGQSVGVAVIGGYVYDGDAISDLQGKYVFGDWTQDPTFRQPAGQLFVASTPGDDGEMGSMRRITLPNQDGGLGRYVVAFGRDRDGELYVLTTTRAVPDGETGELLKLVPATEQREADATGTPTAQAGNGTASANGTTSANKTGDSTQTTQTDTPGFGLLVAVGGIAASYVAMRLRSDDAE